MENEEIAVYGQMTFSSGHLLSFALDETRHYWSKNDYVVSTGERDAMRAQDDGFSQKVDSETQMLRQRLANAVALTHLLTDENETLRITLQASRDLIKRAAEEFGALKSQYNQMVVEVAALTPKPEPKVTRNQFAIRHDGRVEDWQR